MKNKTIEIYLFIDALGWKIANDYHFLRELLPYRKKITMQFGYSSSAIPTILSGKTPAEHGHLGLFRFAPGESPFKRFSQFAFFLRPRDFWRRGRVRHHLSKLLQKFYGFTGYFQLYSMPVEKLKYMDYCEKKDLFASRGMAPIDNLFDELSRLRVPFHISNWRLSDSENYLAAEKAIIDGKTFLFVYSAGLDGFLHEHIGNSKAIGGYLEQMSKQIASLYAVARQNAERVNFTVISDHGMTPLSGTIDLMAALKSSDLKFGKDYGVCFDSTMARFYFLTSDAEIRIRAILDAYRNYGHILTVAEECGYGIFRADRRFGDCIFLVNPGLQIVPSDMGTAPLKGMHGYAPEDIDSYAVMLSNIPIPEKIEKVVDYFDLMTKRAGLL